MDCRHRKWNKVYETVNKIVQECKECGKDKTIYIRNDQRTWFEKNKHDFSFDPPD